MDNYMEKRRSYRHRSWKWPDHQGRSLASLVIVGRPDADIVPNLVIGLSGDHKGTTS